MVNTETERKQDLLEAAQAAIASKSGFGLPSGGGRGASATRWAMVWTGLTLAGACAGYVAGVQPDWAFPNKPVAESPELTVASMRLSLVRERQRVEAFRQREGRLPTSLTEAGGTATNIEMVAQPGNGYLLRTVQNGTALELRSSEPLDAFLGNSLQLILNRRNGP